MIYMMENLGQQTANVDFFQFCQTLRPEQLQGFLRKAKLTHFEADTYVFHQGDSGDAMYVVNDGIVEIIGVGSDGAKETPIAYLSKGEIFGESELITGTIRLQSARVPTSADLLVFTRNDFDLLMKEAPSFARFIAAIEARRYQKCTLQLQFQSQLRELTGSLSFFDLPTVFQTIAVSSQSGNMEIFDADGKIIGSFFFVAGLPIKSRLRHIEGDEALWEVFLDDFQGSFNFTCHNPRQNLAASRRNQSMTEVLMTALHKRDELGVIRPKLGPLNHPYKRVNSTLKWNNADPVLSACAKEVWKVLTHRLASALDVRSEVPFCQLHIYQVLLELLETHQIEKTKSSPYGFA